MVTKKLTEDANGLVEMAWAGGPTSGRSSFTGVWTSVQGVLRAREIGSACPPGPEYAQEEVPAP